MSSENPGVTFILDTHCSILYIKKYITLLSVKYFHIIVTDYKQFNLQGMDCKIL